MRKTETHIHREKRWGETASEIERQRQTDGQTYRQRQVHVLREREEEHDIFIWRETKRRLQKDRNDGERRDWQIYRPTSQFQRASERDYTYVIMTMVSEEAINSGQKLDPQVW